MGYRLNRLDEPIFMAVPNLMLTDFDIHYRLESCESLSVKKSALFCMDLLFCNWYVIFSRLDHKTTKICGAFRGCSAKILSDEIYIKSKDGLQK